MRNINQHNDPVDKSHVFIIIYYKSIILNSFFLSQLKTIYTWLEEFYWVQRSVIPKTWFFKDKLFMIQGCSSGFLALKMNFILICTSGNLLKMSSYINTLAKEIWSGHQVVTWLMQVHLLSWATFFLFRSLAEIKI